MKKFLNRLLVVALYIWLYGIMNENIGRFWSVAIWYPLVVVSLIIWFLRRKQKKHENVDG